MKKAWPWLIGAIAMLSWFTYFETMAFVHPDQYDTLSHTVSIIGAKWPFFLVLFGYVTGGLSVHFFWAWAANPMGKGGG